MSQAEKTRGFFAAAFTIAILLTAPSPARAASLGGDLLFDRVWAILEPLAPVFSFFPTRPPEITAIIGAQDDLAKRVKLYRSLIGRVGPAKAQEALYRSGLPFDGGTHLLNHTVGDYLYETEGLEGIVDCRDYFLASCYHGFTLNAIADYGIEVLEQIVSVCERAGRAVLAQCAHGIGHGLVAFYGYANLPRAAAGCESLEMRLPGFPSFNCYDGVFMENIWGIHDGAPSPDRWVKDDDPFFPCYDPRIEEPWRVGCWSNQGSAFFHRFEGDVERAAALCASVSAASYREICFESLARQIHPSGRGDIHAMEAMCAKTGEGRKNRCLRDVATAEYSTGGRVLPFRLCDLIAEEPERDACYRDLARAVGVYARNTPVKERGCDLFPDKRLRESCRAAPGPR